MLILLSLLYNPLSYLLNISTLFTTFKKSYFIFTEAQFSGRISCNLDCGFTFASKRYPRCITSLIPTLYYFEVYHTMQVIVYEVQTHGFNFSWESPFFTQGLRQDSLFEWGEGMVLFLLVLYFIDC